MTNPEAKNPRAGATMGRREANVAARRQRILESARSLLQEAGPEGLSMRKLARQAGLSVTTLYNLLGSREQILQALIKDSVQRLEEPAPDARATRDPLRRAVRAMEGILQYVIDNGDLLRPLIVADFRTGSWSRLAQQDEAAHFKSSKEAVRAAITEALHNGQLRNVVGLEFLEVQLHVGWELALDLWAFGVLDDEAFRLKSLSGFYVTLLAFAEPHVRPGIEKELRRLERKHSSVGARRKPGE
ncbi:MAG: TetR/AcrR family transcriptional regulator [Acidobacteria bacterium]|nr:TetR/AcrR family transcriptional regulator [Acidobacteriota bacterium]MCY3966243.1 TetR/AcrR family transcriptional regulator [Acidobacteriota bacterium]